MKLNDSQKQILLHLGYLEKDLPQIEESIDKTIYKINDKKKITAKQAMELIGDEDKFLSSIGRSTFHASTSREIPPMSGYGNGDVTFDSSWVFDKSNKTLTLKEIIDTISDDTLTDLMGDVRTKESTPPNQTMVLSSFLTFEKEVNKKLNLFVDEDRIIKAINDAAKIRIPEYAYKSIDEVVADKNIMVIIQMAKEIEVRKRTGEYPSDTIIKQFINHCSLYDRYASNHSVESAILRETEKRLHNVAAMILTEFPGNYIKVTENENTQDNDLEDDYEMY